MYWGPFQRFAASFHCYCHPYGVLSYYSCPCILRLPIHPENMILNRTRVLPRMDICIENVMSLDGLS